MFIEFPISLYKASDVDALASQILSFFSGTKEIEMDEKLQQILQLAASSQKELSAALGKSAGNPYTEALAEKNEERGSDFIGFRDFIKANTVLKDSTVSNPAKMIMDFIEERGFTLYKYSYIKQTSAEKGLINDIEAKPELLNAIPGAKTWFENMKASQNEFETVYNQNTQEKSRETTGVAILKANTAFYLDYLVKTTQVNAKLEIKGFEDASATLIETVNKFNKSVRARLAKTQTKKKNPPLEQQE